MDGYYSGNSKTIANNDSHHSRPLVVSPVFHVAPKAKYILSNE